MKAYEYKRVDLIERDMTLLELLNDMGANGWRYIENNDGVVLLERKVSTKNRNYQQVVCPTCKGTGMRGDDICSTCGGFKQVYKEKNSERIF